MLKTYNYDGWKFGLRHLVPTLLNLGMEETAILNQDFYVDKLLKERLERNDLRFNIQDFLPDFIKKRFETGGIINLSLDDADSEEEENPVQEEHKLSYLHIDSDEESEGSSNDNIPEDYHWDPIKYSIVRRIVETICDLVTTFPTLTTIVPEKKSSQDWTECLVGLYVLATLASDWHLIIDSGIHCAITNAFRTMLDGFSK